MMSLRPLPLARVPFGRVFTVSVLAAKRKTGGGGGSGGAGVAKPAGKRISFSRHAMMQLCDDLMKAYIVMKDSPGDDA